MKTALGTDDGKTIARLLRCDPEAGSAGSRRRSLPGYLRAKGYAVSPKLPGSAETPAVNGGYTVRSYGSSHEDGLDATQIEIASPLRDNEGNRATLIETLAYAIGSLVARRADTHTLAGFRSINLFGGGVVQMVTG